MRYCTHCGAEINDDAVFCVNCGKAVERPANENSRKIKYCTYCGAELKDEADVCLSCGRRVERPPHFPPPPARNDTNNTLATIAKIFMVISCAAYGIAAAYCLIFAIYFTVAGVAATEDVRIALGAAPL